MAVSMTRPAPSMATILGVLFAAVLSVGLAVTEVLSDYLYAAAYFAQSTWMRWVVALDAEFQQAGDGATVGAVIGNTAPIWGAVLAAFVVIGSIGSWLAAWRSGRTWTDVAGRWAVSGGRWLVILLLWSQARLIAFLLNHYLLEIPWADPLLAATAEFVWAVVCGLVIGEWWLLAQPANRPLTIATPIDSQERFAKRILWGVFITYSLIYTAMNWGLWANMRLPHGDSAMYEEHLWNLTHGKGFRSYLDNGRLFLGEHIQVIHVGLLPLHLLWPSQLMMELAQTLGIAALVFPLYSITKRHTGSPMLAAGLAALALLAFPIHYLDIAIDGKTFRPTAFGFAIVLAAIDAFEARAWRRLAFWVVLTLTIQEDFSLVLGPLGLWFAWDGWRKKEHRTIGAGLALCVASAAYLWVVMNVVLPWFRNGETIHYAKYFEKFGATPVGILWGMLTQPGLVWESFMTTTSLIHALCLLVPLGLLPLASPSRLLVAAPLFGLLCMNELAQNPPGPFHHFHAPIMPLLLWAAAAGLGKLERFQHCSLHPLCSPLPPGEGLGVRESVKTTPDTASGLRAFWIRCLSKWAAYGLAFGFGCSFWTGLVHDNSPLGLRFWDSGRTEYWRDRYLPDERVRQFAKVLEQLPPTVRVASTDYVHTRLTHYERSYDYSDYRRTVPDDCDYIVIDTRGPYAKIRYAEEIPELRTAPEKWELLPDVSQGYFLVLKRR